MTKEIWTPTEEAAFLALQERRERVQAAMKAGVTTLVDRHFTGMPAEAKDAMFLILTKHADDWRDALAPFDSGVRPASQAVPEGVPRGGWAAPNLHGVSEWPEVWRPNHTSIVDVQFRNGVQSTGELHGGRLLGWTLDNGPDDIVAWRYAG